MEPRSVLVALADAASSGDIAQVERVARNDRLVESFRRLMGAFPDVMVSIEWTVEEGDRASGWARIQGTHTGAWRGFDATNRPIDVHGMLAVQVRPDGSVEDFWLANDWLSIATQIGVLLSLP